MDAACSAGCGTPSPVSDSDPFFLAEDLADPLPPIGTSVVLGGPEGRHAAVVRRLRVGEIVVVTDGRGRAVRGPVRAVAKDGITVEVVDQLLVAEPDLRFVVVQALAKGDRSELAVEMLTEIGVAEIVPWQASRSIVRWSGERGDKGRSRWQATAREAAKQSRRLRVPAVASLVNTEQLLARISWCRAGARPARAGFDMPSGRWRSPNPARC